MLQKLPKCEVKAWLCWNLVILLPLGFYVKSNFGKFKQSKNVIIGNFRPSEVWNLVKLGLESCSNLPKIKYRTSKIGKNYIFGSLEFAKVWFHVKSEWRKNDQMSTKPSLNFTFWKFLEHSEMVENNLGKKISWNYLFMYPVSTFHLSGNQLVVFQIRKTVEVVTAITAEPCGDHFAKWTPPPPKKIKL